MAREEKVTKVINGDTFKTTSRKNPVRLANVDAPEKGQPGSAKATKALNKIIQREEVRIDTVSHDKYGRAVANVYKTKISKQEKMWIIKRGDNFYTG